MEQYDYTAELVAKWTDLGYLGSIKEQDRTKVAQRLEAAHRRSLGAHGDFQALQREVNNLRREGYYGRR